MVDDRDERGRYRRGCKGGPGRPAMAQEHRYLLTMQSACSLEDWQEITAKAVSAAKAGDHRAREWLAKYLCPPPMHSDEQMQTVQEDERDADERLVELLTTLRNRKAAMGYVQAALDESKRRAINGDDGPACCVATALDSELAVQQSHLLLNERQK